MERASKNAVLALLLVVSALDLGALTITLTPTETEYYLSEGFKFYLSYINDGNQSVFIARPRAFGEGRNSLQIVAQKGGCTYRVSPLHYDSHAEDLKFFFVPLLQGDSLKEALPTIGDGSTVSGLDLFLPGPGSYEFRVEYRSEGPAYEAFVGPIWRGHVVSQAVNIDLHSPRSEEIRRWRTKLRECVEDGSCMGDPSVSYFLYVKDESASRLLAEALRVEPNDTFAAEALFRQATPQAAEVLRTMGGELTLDNEIRRFYLNLAEKLEMAEHQDCPEVLSYDPHSLR